MAAAADFLVGMFAIEDGAWEWVGSGQCRQRLEVAKNTKSVWKICVDSFGDGKMTAERFGKRRAGGRLFMYWSLDPEPDSINKMPSARPPQQGSVLVLLTCWPAHHAVRYLASLDLDRWSRKTGHPEPVCAACSAAYPDPLSPKTSSALQSLWFIRPFMPVLQVLIGWAHVPAHQHLPLRAKAGRARDWCFNASHIY